MRNQCYCLWKRPIVLLALVSSLLVGCGGGGSSDTKPVTESAPTGVLVGAYDPSGVALVGGEGPGLLNSLTFPGSAPVLANYSPVAVHVQWTPTAIPLSKIVEYHVYRSDFTTAPARTSDHSAPPTILPVGIQSSHAALDFWDDGTDRPLSFITINPFSGKPIIVASTGYAAINTGIKVPVVGKRLQYSVEILWKDQSGMRLTAKSAVNGVTYLQPVMLSSSSFTGVSPTRVWLTLRATLSADDYVLELSPDASFATKKTLTPFNAGLIQVSAASQYVPRLGPDFPFFDPTNGFDMSSVFPGAAAIYARAGVRDSRNGLDIAKNPYLYSETVQVPIQLI